MSQSTKYLESPKTVVKISNEHKGRKILDVGGGGEGIISLVYGKNVVAIDKRKEELEDVSNNAVKLVMDACNLQFTNTKFDVVTMLFSLMYMNAEDKVKAIIEAKKILDEDGILQIWEPSIPIYDGGEKNVFVQILEFDLPSKKIQTGYGCKMTDKSSNIDYISSIVEECGFTINNKMQLENGVFRLDCSL